MSCARQISTVGCAHSRRGRIRPSIGATQSSALVHLDVVDLNGLERASEDRSLGLPVASRSGKAHPW